MLNHLEVDGHRVRFGTSYFYQLRFMKKHEEMLPVSICIWDPRWYDGMRYPGLVPKEYHAESDCEACYKKHPEVEWHDLHCEYLNHYRKQLYHYHVERTLQDVTRKAIAFYGKQNLKDLYVIFMGFEVPAKLCSERFILSEWINQSLNMRDFCVELSYPLT